MLTKLFFIVYGTLLLTACILADATDETLHDYQLERRVADNFDASLNNTISSLRKHVEPVINDVASKKIQINARTEEKLDELKAILEKSMPNNNEKLLAIKEIVLISIEIEKIEIELANDASDGDDALQLALSHFKRELGQITKTFTIDSYKDLERYWNTLIAREKKGQLTMGDKMKALKNSPAAKVIAQLEQLYA